MEDTTLIDIIEREMSTDDADRQKESDYLRDYYSESSEAEKKRIDLCFMALCGWSLETLLKR